jgi:hypothetical protein
MARRRPCCPGQRHLRDSDAAFDVPRSARAPAVSQVLASPTGRSMVTLRADRRARGLPGPAHRPPSGCAELTFRVRLPRPEHQLAFVSSTTARRARWGELRPAASSATARGCSSPGRDTPGSLGAGSAAVVPEAPNLTWLSTPFLRDRSVRSGRAGTTWASVSRRDTRIRSALTPATKPAYAPSSCAASPTHRPGPSRHRLGSRSTNHGFRPRGPRRRCGRCTTRRPLRRRGRSHRQRGGAVRDLPRSAPR